MSKKVPAPTSPNSSTTVSVEKIDNGFLVRESHYSGDEYRCSTRYCPTKPKIEVPSVREAVQKSAAPAKSSLRKAMDSI